MEETTLKFVHVLGVWAVAIHEELGTGDAILAGITYMLNVLAMTGMVSHELVIFQGVLPLLVIAPG